MLKSRVIWFESPGVVSNKVNEIDEKLLPGQVLIKNQYSLLSTGTELEMLAGNEYWFPLPGVPGYCCVGTIIDKADDVSDLEVGENVYYKGRHEEYAVVDVMKAGSGAFTGFSPGAFFVKVPDEVDMSGASLVCMSAIAMTALRVSSIVLGDYVAITGQGLVGNMATQLAALQGARTIAIDISDYRLSISKNMGADYVINPFKEDLFKRIDEITKGVGVDVWIEATGSPKVIAEDLPMMRRHSELVLLGTPRGDYKDDLAPVLRYCHIGEYDVRFIGAHEISLPIVKTEGSKFSMEECASLSMELLKDKKLNIEGLISDFVKPNEAQKVYDLLKTDKSSHMGYMFDWT